MGSLRGIDTLPQPAARRAGTKPAAPSSGETAGKNVVAILVSVLILIAAIAFAIIIVLHACCYPPTPWPITTVDTTDEASGNWSLTVTATQPGLNLSETVMEIFNGNNLSASLIRVTVSDLTEGNWTTYGILYRKVSNETEVEVGASILVSKTLYPKGCFWYLNIGSRTLCNGRLGNGSP